MRVRFKGAALLVTAGFFSACGDGMLTENDFGDPLFVINGKLTADGTDVPDSLHVAAVWVGAPAAGSSGDVFVAQTVEVATFSFPVSFELGLTELPPLASMHSWSQALNDPSVSGDVAWAILVAFEDLNGDGQLNLPDLTTAALDDRIVAITDDFTYLSFIEGNVPTQLAAEGGPFGLMHSGFNLVGPSPLYNAYDTIREAKYDCEEQAAGNTTGIAVCEATFEQARDALGLAAEGPIPEQFTILDEVEIPLVQSPHAGERFCPALVETFLDFGVGEEAPDTLPPIGADYVCGQNDRAVCWREPVETLCVTNDGLDWCRYLGSSESVPTDWPCGI